MVLLSIAGEGDGMVCIRYAGDGSLGRITALPKAFKLRELTGGCFALDVMSVYTSRTQRKAEVLKKRGTLSSRVSHESAVVLQTLGVPMVSLRQPGYDTWRRRSATVILRGEVLDVMAWCLGDFAVHTDDEEGVSRIYDTSTGDEVVRLDKKGRPLAYGSVAEAKRAIERHLDARSAA